MPNSYLVFTASNSGHLGWEIHFKAVWGEKKGKIQRNNKEKLYHQLYHNGIRQLCMLLLDGWVSFQYDGEAGVVIATMARDFLLRTSWPSKSPQLLYWESNLLNISSQSTPFPIDLFLGKLGLVRFWKTSRKFLRYCFPLLPPFYRKETLSLQDLWHSSNEAAIRELPTKASHSTGQFQTIYPP